MIWQRSLKVTEAVKMRKPSDQLGSVVGTLALPVAVAFMESVTELCTASRAQLPSELCADDALTVGGCQGVPTWPPHWVQ